MGAVKKALKPVTKFVDRIVPNEIKPALPFVAATFGAPYLAGSGILGALGKGALGKGLAGGLLNVGTQALLGQKISPMSALFSAGTIGGGQYLKGAESKFLKGLGSILSPDKISAMAPGEVLKAGYTPVGAGATKSAYDAAEEANRAYEEYLASQEAAGAEDIQSRVDFITSYMTRAGYGQERIDETLANAGYLANGGRVGYEFGGMTEAVENVKQEDMLGGISSLGKLVMPFLKNVPGEEQIEEMRQNKIKEYMGDVDLGEYPSMESMEEAQNLAEEKADEYINQYLDLIYKYEDILPYKSRPNPPEGSIGSDVIEQIMGPRKENRVKEADGGIINLQKGGMPMEMDLRGGGFVPIGKKERADDVPARLSKNEFVMTADAVRAAGGGSVNKGAKKMYDLMNKLEARV